MDPNSGSDGDNVEGILDITMPGNISMNDSSFNGSGVFNMSNDEGLPGNVCNQPTQPQNNPYARDMIGEGLQDVSMPRNLNDSNLSSIYDVEDEGLYDIQDPGDLSMSICSNPPLNTSGSQSPGPYFVPNNFSPRFNINGGLFGIAEPNNRDMDSSNASSIYDTSGGIFDMQDPGNLSMSTCSSPGGYPLNSSRGASPRTNAYPNFPANNFPPGADFNGEGLFGIAEPRNRELDLMNYSNTSSIYDTSGQGIFDVQDPGNLSTSVCSNQAGSPRGRSAYPNSTYSTPNRNSPRSNRNDLMEFSPPAAVSAPLNWSISQASTGGSPFRGQSPPFSNGANVSRGQSPNTRNFSPGQSPSAAYGAGNTSPGRQPQNNSMLQSNGSPGRFNTSGGQGMNNEDVFRTRTKMVCSPPGGNAAAADRFNTSGGQEMNNEDVFRTRAKMGFSPTGNAAGADRFNTSGGQRSNAGSPFRVNSPGGANNANISGSQMSNSRNASPGGNTCVGGQPQNVSPNNSMNRSRNQPNGSPGNMAGGMNDEEVFLSRPKMAFSPQPTAYVPFNTSGGQSPNAGNPSRGQSPVSNNGANIRQSPNARNVSPGPSTSGAGNISRGGQPQNLVQNVNMAGGMNMGGMDEACMQSRPKMAFSPQQTYAANVSQSPRVSPGRNVGGQTPNSRRVSPRRGSGSAKNAAGGASDAFVMQTLSADAAFQDVLRQTIQKQIQTTFKQMLLYQLDQLVPDRIEAYLDEFYTPIVNTLVDTGVIPPSRPCKCSTNRNRDRNYLNCMRKPFS